jgi:UDP-N-acetylmuramoyl-L-alanyl-D-glutamate--2,6-diaminopimelate ligase
MRLAEILAHVPVPAAGVEVGSLAYDSRRVTPGALFFCVSGLAQDGHAFAPQAIERGAVALVVERPLGLGVPEVLVPSARAVMPLAAARFHGHPSHELGVIGVTGTNGKTTTAYLVRHLLQSAGAPCGLLGTIVSIVAGEEKPVARTTPEAIDLQADFRAMLDGGERWCAMEVSSHALELGRTAAIRYAAAIFTNLTQDHLDFHPTMEDYFAAKRRLLADDPGVRVVNVDDPYGRRLAEEFPDAITVALEHPADYAAREVSVARDGSRFTLHAPWGELPIHLPLPGRFNVANALGALAAVSAVGVGDPRALAGALTQAVYVPGRVQPVREGQEFAVLVDYAHTPDSLENVLTTARELTDGRLWCVFGAGGDRDRGKRPLMGEVAARLADVAVATSDNPRSEDPETILDHVMVGVDRAYRPPGAQAPVRIADRRAAIAHAIQGAQPGDVVVIAGKGHEQGQEFEGGRKLPFDDVEVAREALRARADREHG